MRLIDGDALYETLCHIWDRTDSEEFEKDVFEIIINAPIIEPERKKGKWYEDEDVGLCRCDQCNGVNLIHTPFCPMCGAKMEVENE